MTPTFDAAAGRLRITDAHLSALIALAQGVPRAELHDADVTALDAAGLLGAAAPEAVRLAVAGIDGAQVRLEVATRGPRGVLVHRVWVREGAATVVAQTRADLYDVLPLPPALVPAALARLLGLGPRGLVPGDPVEIDDDPVAELAGGDLERAAAADAVAARAPAGWAELLADVRAGSVRWHGLGALWIGVDGEPTGRRFSVLDTPHGFLEVAAAGDRTVLRPVRAGDVWVMLADLLPADGEIAAVSDVAPAVAVGPTDTDGGR